MRVRAPGGKNDFVIMNVFDTTIGEDGKVDAKPVQTWTRCK